MTGTKASQARFTNNVGTGSTWHCFAANVIQMAATSATIVDQRTDSGSVTGRSLITGDKAGAVDERIRSILSVK